MPKRIVIIGAGGFGRELLSLIDKHKYEPFGFIDKESKEHFDLPLPIIGDDQIIPELITKQKITHISIALGDMFKRKNIFQIASNANLTIPSIIHSSSTILSLIDSNYGIIVYPNVVVMNNCKIGKSVLLNSGVTVGHDVEIGDFSSISPGAHLAGTITVGQQVLIGIGSCIKENVEIGDRVIIGAGSVVVNNVPDDVIVYGSPAKIKDIRP